LVDAVLLSELRDGEPAKAAATVFRPNRPHRSLGKLSQRAILPTLGVADLLSVVHVSLRIAAVEMLRTDTAASVALVDVQDEVVRRDGAVGKFVRNAMCTSWRRLAVCTSSDRSVAADMDCPVSVLVEVASPEPASIGLADL